MIHNCPHDPTLSCDCPEGQCVDLTGQLAYSQLSEAKQTSLLPFIIPAGEDDLHTLDIQRTGDLLYITTNNRKMYQKWGTLAWDASMVRQLIAGLEAVLAGAPRACTQLQLDLEANEQMLAEAARTRNREASTATAINYDDLFGES